MRRCRATRTPMHSTFYKSAENLYAPCLYNIVDMYVVLVHIYQMIHFSVARLRVRCIIYSDDRNIKWERCAYLFAENPSVVFTVYCLCTNKYHYVHCSHRNYLIIFAILHQTHQAASTTYYFWMYYWVWCDLNDYEITRYILTAVRFAIETQRKME